MGRVTFFETGYHLPHAFRSIVVTSLGVDGFKGMVREKFLTGGCNRDDSNMKSKEFIDSVLDGITMNNNIDTNNNKNQSETNNPKNITLTTDLNSALTLASTHPQKTWIVGGSRIYSEALINPNAEELMVTVVDCIDDSRKIGEGGEGKGKGKEIERAFFPDESEWGKGWGLDVGDDISYEENGWRFKFLTYSRCIGVEL